MNVLASRSSLDSLLSPAFPAGCSRRDSLRALALLAMTAVPARGAGAASASSPPQSWPTGDTVIDVPFALIRLLLPADGLPPEDHAARPIRARNTISFLIGDENKWTGRDDFERHEMAELALGYVLRAKPDDREHREEGERPMGPGFRENGDHVLVQGGWRAHKAMAGAGDYFDGRFTAKLRYFMEGRSLRARCEDLKLEWNGNILEFADGALERKIARELEAGVNEKLQKEMLDPIAKAIREAEELKVVRERTRLEVVGTTVRITVATGSVVA